MGGFWRCWQVSIRYAAKPSSIWITLNRLLIFTSKPLYYMLSSEERVKYMAPIPWCFGVHWLLMTTFYQERPKTFSIDGFYLYQKTDNKSCTWGPPELQIFVDVTSSWFASVTPYICLCAYIFIYGLVRLQRKQLESSMGAGPGDKGENRKRMKQERSLLSQGFIIQIVLIIKTFTFSQSKYLSGLSKAWFGSYLPSGMLVSCMVIVNSSTAPFIYFTFNSTVRRCLLQLFGFKSATNTSVFQSLPLAKSKVDRFGKLLVKRIAQTTQYRLSIQRYLNSVGTIDIIFICTHYGTINSTITLSFAIILLEFL